MNKEKNTNLIKLEIVFDNSTSSTDYNKQLINYFKNNLHILNKLDILVIWNIASKEEYKFYQEKGIKRFPVLIIPPKSFYYGVNDIIKEITNCINKRQKMLNSTKIINNGMASVSDEALYEYQRKAIGNAEDDETDPKDGFENVFRKRQNEMIRRRQMAGMESPMNNEIPKSNNSYQVNIPDERKDNVNPMNLDPSDSLQRLRRQPGNDMGDIDLMQMQLDKMDSSINMDYY
jgi:hypothetical protein